MQYSKSKYLGSACGNEQLRASWALRSLVSFTVRVQNRVPGCSQQLQEERPWKSLTVMGHRCLWVTVTCLHETRGHPWVLGKRTSCSYLWESFLLQISVLVRILKEWESKNAEVINFIHLCIFPTAIFPATCGEGHPGYSDFSIIPSRETHC